MKLSINPSVTARTWGSSSFIRPGEKYGLRTLRSSCCRGGSKVITMSPNDIGLPSSPRGLLEKLRQSRKIS